MSSSAYDPRKFEFVARMGRIPGPEDGKPSGNMGKERIPVMFRIPDIPEQEIKVGHDIGIDNTAKLGRSMRAVSLDDNNDNKPINFDDYMGDRPSIDDVSKSESNEVKETKSTFLKTMIESRQKMSEERKMRQHAQYLINEALLQPELREMKERSEMLEHINKLMESGSGDKDIERANIFKESRPPEELMEIIREELKRLVPIIPEQKKS